MQLTNLVNKQLLFSEKKKKKTDLDSHTVWLTQDAPVCKLSLAL